MNVSFAVRGWINLRTSQTQDPNTYIVDTSKMILKFTQGDKKSIINNMVSAQQTKVGRQTPETSRYIIKL